MSLARRACSSRTTGWCGRLADSATSPLPPGWVREPFVPGSGLAIPHLLLFSSDRSGRGALRRPALVPDVGEQCAVAGQVAADMGKPARLAAVDPGTGLAVRLRRCSLADGEDERVPYGPLELPVVIA